MLETLTAADFEAQLQTSFWCTLADQEYELILANVERLPSYGNRPASNQSFSLLFYLPSGHYLPQQIYELRHASMAQLSIFMVPVGRDQHGLHLQAIFNHA
jgi:hypothetical protein